MSLINETTSSETIETKTYDRANSITFYNPYRSVPSVEFSEETITETTRGGATEVKSSGVISSLTENFTPANASETYPLRNPETGDIIPGQTGQYQDLYVHIFSLYYHLDSKRP